MRLFKQFSLVLPLLICVSSVPSARADDPVAPASMPGIQPAFEIILDTSAAPDLATFGETARIACQQAYPSIAEKLKSDGYIPPRKVTIIIKPMKGVAGTSGDRIECSSEYFAKHTDDVGAIVHELTHAIQAYPKYDPVWLVEGIADYVRFFMWEPESKRPHPNAAKVKFKESYRTAAAFLAWAEGKYDRDLINRLNSACRNTQYSDDLFKQCTGKSLEDLWEEWVASLPKK